MVFNQMKVLVVGLARSGVAVAKVLSNSGARVTITDSKPRAQLGEWIDQASPYVSELILGDEVIDLKNYELLVVSPGVPLEIPLIKNAKALGIKVIGEIELSYIFAKGTFVGITGTNGKTTTTALVGEMFKGAFEKTKIVGNIGYPAIIEAANSDHDTVLVTELSSFQLESVFEFKPSIAAVLNITPDHLNRHKTMTAYVAAKANIFKNQRAEDALVYNAEDVTCIEMAKNAKSRIYGFSSKRALKEGAFLENGLITTVLDGEKTTYCHTNELLILGNHNIENALAATLIAALGKVDTNTISAVLKKFTGVAHRIESLGCFNGVMFYNDSKATNPDSTICAIRAMERPTHLIAGGMDKGSDFTEMFQAFGNRIKSLILLGETKSIIEKKAKEMGFFESYTVENMEEAVRCAFELAKKGDAVLLSPACASWDMYRDFEARGDHFKRCVKGLQEAK